MAFLAQVPMHALSSSISVIRLLMSYIPIPKTETTLWISRILSILFAVSYTVSLYLYGVNFYILYCATLISSILASGTLLRQKWLSVQLGRVLLEDSCHYLLYAILFLTVSPTFFALVPLFIFSGLPCLAAALKLFHPKGQISTHKFDKFVENQRQNILLLVVLFEVILLVVIPFVDGLSIWNLFVLVMYFLLLRHRYALEVNPFAIKKLKQLDLNKLKKEIERYENTIDKLCKKHSAVVHFWKPKVYCSHDFPFVGVQVGHLALTLSDGTHISLWPHGKNELKEDIELEECLPDAFNEIPTDEFVANKLLNTLPLDGCGNFPKHCLIQNDVKIWWEKCADDGYHILRNNCAQTVQKALLAGHFESEQLDWLPVLVEVKRIDKRCYGKFNDLLVEPPTELHMTDDIKVFLEALQEELISSVKCFNSIQSVDAAVLQNIAIVFTKNIASLSHEARRQLTDDMRRLVSEGVVANWLRIRHALYTAFCFNCFMCNDVTWDAFMANEEVQTFITKSVLNFTLDNPHNGYMYVYFSRFFIPEISANLVPVPGPVYKYVCEVVRAAHSLDSTM